MPPCVSLLRSNPPDWNDRCCAPIDPADELMEVAPPPMLATDSLPLTWPQPKSNSSARTPLALPTSPVKLNTPRVRLPHRLSFLDEKLRSKALLPQTVTLSMRPFMVTLGAGAGAWANAGITGTPSRARAQIATVRRFLITAPWPATELDQLARQNDQPSHRSQPSGASGLRKYRSPTGLGRQNLQWSAATGQGQKLACDLEQRHRALLA